MRSLLLTFDPWQSRAVLNVSERVWTQVSWLT